MTNWYRVIKTIKGYRYLYDQRTWREGKHVRTESRYVGPLDGRATSRLAYHGARAGLSGAITPSSSGTFGPGFYLTTRERAADYATYDARWAANPAAGLPQPQHAGEVYAFDLARLRLKVLETWDAYFDLVDELLEVQQGYATPADKARVTELLAAQGYDGLEVCDPDRTETVVFPSSVHKLEALPVTTTRAGDEAADEPLLRAPPGTGTSRARRAPAARQRAGAGSLYETVTARIIDELKAGTVPWVKPWKAGLGAGGANCMPCNAVTGRKLQRRECPHPVGRRGQQGLYE